MRSIVYCVQISTLVQFVVRCVCEVRIRYLEIVHNLKGSPYKSVGHKAFTQEYFNTQIQKMTLEDVPETNMSR